MRTAALACGVGLLIGGGVLTSAVMGWNSLLQGVAARHVSPGCPQEQERVGEALGRLRVLDVRPPGARPSKRYAGCDPEVDLAYADRSYALRGTHEAVPALYCSAAVSAYADRSYALRGTHEAVPALYRSAAVSAYADRSYALRGTHEAVPALYRSAAVSEGWEVVRAPNPATA
ncbi:hypothetical protein [Spongiactinospora sp. 9N601]|uniref:hypothetical protein n=1 Tax=Spongiactinospora sp. 9N601 TaxID=3375149 RepID=UPI00379315A1